MTAPIRRFELSRLAVSVAEGSNMLGMSETLFRSEVLPGLPRVNVGTKILLDVDDLRRWLAGRRVTGPAEQAPKRRTRSFSVSTDDVANSPRVREIERRLTARVAASTAKSSPDLHESKGR